MNRNSPHVAHNLSTNLHVKSIPEAFDRPEPGTQSGFDILHFSPEGNYAMAQSLPFLLSGTRKDACGSISRDGKRGIFKKKP